jgi:hypothetical protein
MNRDPDISEVPKSSQLDYGGFQPSAQRIDEDAIRKKSVAAMQSNVAGEIRNPLLGIPKEQLMDDVDAFAKKYGMTEQLHLLRKGALVAQNPADFENLAELDDADRQVLRDEVLHRWRHPWSLYFTIVRLFSCPGW